MSESDLSLDEQLERLAIGLRLAGCTDYIGSNRIYEGIVEAEHPLYGQLLIKWPKEWA